MKSPSHLNRIGIFISSLTLLCVIFLSAQLVEAECAGLGIGYGYENCDLLVKFKDTTGHDYKDAIRYVQEQGIVKGYSDGTYRPETSINRAEFTKILVIAQLGSNPPEASEDCFPDVPKNEWFAKYVCYAKQNNILSGYPDGTFQPSNNVNFGEAAKIIANTFKLPSGEVNNTGFWFTPYIESLAKNKAIPTSVTTYFAKSKRGEMAEMIMRLKTKRKDLPSLSTCDLVVQACDDMNFSGYGDELYDNIDMQKVRVAWLVWYNTERRAEGLHDYVLNGALNRSAYLWSKYSHEVGQISHKRPGQEAYYDYGIISQWFADLGLIFENVYRVTFSENIGGGVVSCRSEDCTGDLINSIRSTFDFYMGEKEKEYRPHYNSVMNKHFNEIGLGIVVDENTGRYYLTVHYGTKIISD